MTSLRALRVVGGIVALGGLAWSAARVAARERSEVELRTEPAALARLRETDPHRTEQTVRIGEVRLRTGERYLVELCAEGRVDPEAWAGGLDAVFWIPATETLVSRAPLDRGRLRSGRSNGRRTCFTVALGDADKDGTYAIELFWPDAAPRPAIDAARLSLHVLGYRLPDRTDRLALALLAIGVVLFLIGLAAPPPVDSPMPARPVVLVLVGLAILAALIVLGGVFSGGSTAILLGGLVVAAGEVAVAVALARGRLALHRSALGGLWLPPLVGVLVLAGSIGAQKLLPPTGVAPVETVIAWPSGKLAFAALGLVVPIAEELFFRGFVYGTLRSRLGGTIALWGTTAIFVLAHVPQQLGNWGGLLGVAVAGVLLTGLRHRTDALWPSIVAHFTYNALLVAISWI